MKKYFVSVSVVFFALTFNLITNQTAQAFERMCCQNSEGCNSAPSSATTCPPAGGFTAIECASCPGGAQTAITTTSAGASGAVTFINPLKVDTVSGVLNNVLGNLKGIIASIAIIFIVVGGFMYILSAGDEKMITKAKATIASALIGLAIALAAPTFLKEIVTILGNGGGATAEEAVEHALTIKQIATRTLNLLLSVVGIIAMISLVIGGSFYFTAYGDEKRIETGKSIITNALIGIAVAMAALVLVKQLSALLGVV
jgi:hypothetical protein